MYCFVCNVWMVDGCYSFIISAKRKEYLNSLFKAGMLSEYNASMNGTGLIQYFFSRQYGTYIPTRANRTLI
jgi:hypothetical protein